MMPNEIKRATEAALACLSYRDNELGRLQYIEAVEQRVQNAIRWGTSYSSAKALNTIPERYYRDDGTYECVAILSYQTQCAQIALVLPLLQERRDQARSLLVKFRAPCEALWSLAPCRPRELERYKAIWGD